jgi:Meckel syndrome type 1 protein
MAQQLADAAATPSPDPQTGDQGASSDQDAALAAAAAGGAGQVATAPTDATAPAPTPPSSGAPDTLANLSAQIVQKVGGQTTRFDVQLDPYGMGRVNVSVQIDAKGVMSAALSFEKPDSANFIRTHSAELQQSLAQAGFNLSSSAFSISTVDQGTQGGFNAGGGGQSALLGGDASGGQQSQGGQARNAGRAFGAASLAADQTDQINTASRTFSARGLDIRI